jgi:hypothetical protein
MRAAFSFLLALLVFLTCSFLRGRIMLGARRAVWPECIVVALGFSGGLARCLLLVLFIGGVVHTFFS